MSRLTIGSSRLHIKFCPPKQLTKKELSSAENVHALIVRGKQGCGCRKILASFRELERARTGKIAKVGRCVVLAGLAG